MRARFGKSSQPSPPFDESRTAKLVGKKTASCELRLLHDARFRCVVRHSLTRAREEGRGAARGSEPVASGGETHRVVAAMGWSKPVSSLRWGADVSTTHVSFLRSDRGCGSKRARRMRCAARRNGAHETKEKNHHARDSFPARLSRRSLHRRLSRFGVPTPSHVTDKLFAPARKPSFAVGVSALAHRPY